jgi:hypothetical protein
VPLLGLSRLSPAGPFGELHTPQRGELVEDAVGELALRGVVAQIVQRSKFAAVFLEFLAQRVEVGGLAGEAVAVLDQHYRHAPAATKSRT